MIAAVLAKPYSRGIHKPNDTADPVAVIRNALSAQFDGNAVVVMVGPPTNLARLLDLPDGKDLIARKAKPPCVTGAWAGAAAKRLFTEWPTPIVAAPKEVGDALPFPAASMEKEFAWAPAHPVVDAWKAAGGQDAPSSGLAAGLYAVRPQEGYFKLSEPGTILVSDDGRASFTPSANGKHRNLIFDPAQKEGARRIRRTGKHASRAAARTARR